MPETNPGTRRNSAFKIRAGRGCLQDEQDYVPWRFVEMTQQEFIKGIRAEIIDQNLATYRDLFVGTDAGSVSDPYWKRALGLHAALSDEQREVLFQIVRQVMVVTTSNLLGVLDGVNWLEGQSEGFKLTTEDGTDKLNEGLQDLLLGMEEYDPR